ncbi:MAG: ABC transporter substrate-binding protein [Actinomycetia bacterium]|nr:ABC transporter substrate-binding protein [Actinomycetes bacterium]
MTISKKLMTVLLALTLAAGLALSACQGSGDSDSSAAGAASAGDQTATGAVGNGDLGLVTPGKLTIGSDCDYPPFISMQAGKPTGFEEEMMQYVAADLGLELNYLPPQNFDTLIPSVNGGGKMDLAVSSLTINDERKESVNFAMPYFDSNQACVTLKGSGYTTADQLDGKVVGAQAGTTGADWVKENLPNATLKIFNQTSEGMAALVAKQVEALFIDEPVAKAMVADTFTDCRVTEVIITGEKYGIAVSKNNPALESAVNDSLKKLVDDGTYAKLFKKYFNYEPSITPESIKN